MLLPLTIYFKVQMYGLLFSGVEWVELGRQFQGVIGYRIGTECHH
jgi:hypothetical protein